MIASVDDVKYANLLAATRPGIITNDAELERLTAEVNRLVTKGIKETQLSPEEEKLLKLLTRLIEDYEQSARHGLLEENSPRLCHDILRTVDYFLDHQSLPHQAVGPDHK